MSIPRACVAVVLALAVGACGGAGGHETRSNRPRRALDGVGENLFNGTRGGTLTVYDASAFAPLDPGEAYSTIDNAVVLATQRPLFSYLPDQTQTPSPDLASGPAIVSPNGRTVTVRIKQGVHFSPPVDREVTSADVAYAIERGANPNVANPYFSSYFDYIVGASRAT